MYRAFKTAKLLNVGVRCIIIFHCFYQVLLQVTLSNGDLGVLASGCSVEVKEVFIALLLVHVLRAEMG